MSNISAICSIFIAFYISLYAYVSSSMTWSVSDVAITELHSTYDAFIAYHNQTVQVIGGVGTHKDLIEFPLSGEWTKSYTMAITVGYQGSQSSIQIGGQLWFLTFGILYLYVFDLDSRNITETISFPGNATHDRCVTSYNDKYILIIGGASGEEEFNIYNTLNKTWLLGTSLTSPRDSHSCNVVGNTVYIIGGFNGSQALNTVQYLQFITCCSGTWQQMSDALFSPKGRHRSIVFEEYIYVIGGYDGTVEIDQVDIIDTASKTIASPTTNKLVYAKRSESVILVDNIIYVFGGKPYGITNIYYQYASILPTSPPSISATSPSMLLTSFLFYATGAFIISMALGSMLAFIYNKKDGTRTDDGDWKILLLLGISVGDFVSDMLLSLEILDQFGDSISSQHDLLLLHIAGFGSIIFIVLPYFINIYTTWKFDQFISENKSAIIHFKKYRMVFIMIMLFTGSTYIAALLLSSKLFGLDIFCSGLTKYEMGKLSKLKVFGAVLAENLPQLIIMSIYAVYKAEAPSNIFVMSCMSSLLSIISALLIYFMERRASNYDVVHYELELLKMNGVQLSKAEIHEISKKKECKKALGKSLGAALNIDQNLLEFGKVTRLHNGVGIKIIHYLFAEDLTDNTYYSLVTDLYDNNRQ